MKKRERVSLRLEAEVHTIEGQLLSYLKADPALSVREATLRALKGFYLPWVLEGTLSEAEIKAIAKTTIEELHYRIFQISQRFLEGEKAAALATMSPLGEAPAESSIAGALAAMQQDLDAGRVHQVLDDF